jgi:ribosomal-protein-alanine N-acetyltransferase
MAMEDIPFILPIESLCFGDRWSAVSFEQELDNHSSTYVVALLDGRIVGYAGFWLILEEAHVTTIAVHPERQGYRIGEQLLLRLVEDSARQGAKWMTLEVRASNVVAQKLYEKYGFTSLGRRRGYYQDDGEDALVMWTENIWQDKYQERLTALKASLLP